MYNESNYILDNVKAAVKWLDEKCYVESPQSEMFNDCILILKSFINFGIKKYMIDYLEQEKEKIGKDIKAWKDCITCIIIDLKFEMKKEREQIEKRTKTD